MKTGKLFWFYVLSFIASINILYIYFGGGFGAVSFTKNYFLSVYKPFLSILGLFIIVIMTSFAYIVISGRKRKKLIKFSLFLLFILLIISFIARIQETIAGNYCILCWTNTILYVILFLLEMCMAKDLYILLRKLFLNKH